MNTDISFPIAKLLEEKGYDEPCANLYYEPERCKKPTIADVVMWLYEKHGIWIEVRKSYTDGFIPLIKPPRKELQKFNSPTEAYSFAIEYALKNSI